MGGGQAMRIGLTHIDKFAYVCAMSAARVRGDDLAAAVPDFIDNPEKVNRELKLLWIGCGEKDQFVKNTTDSDRWFTEHHIRHELQLSSGVHTWLVWRRYLVELAPKLFQD